MENHRIISSSYNCMILLYVQIINFPILLVNLFCKRKRIIETCFSWIDKRKCITWKKLHGFVKMRKTGIKTCGGTTYLRSAILIKIF